MKISCNKTKSMAMLGREQRRVKIIIDWENIEQVPNFKYFGCTISTIEMNADLEENISYYNKLNWCIKRHFGTSMRKDPVEVGRSTSWRGDAKGTLRFSFPSPFLLSPACVIYTISIFICSVFWLAPFACWTPIISPP
jgi:hypothetical protein